MIVYPNYNSAKYLFCMSYNKFDGTYCISYLPYKNDINIIDGVNYIGVLFSNNELINIAITAFLNHNIIILDNINLIKEKKDNIVYINNKNDFHIQYNNNIKLRFSLIYNSEYFAINSIIFDTCDFTIGKYITILDVYGNIDLWEYIADNVLNGNLVYFKRSINMFNITKSDIIIEERDNTMKLIFDVTDNGNYYEVIGLNNNKMVISGSEFITYRLYSYYLYEKILDALLDGKSIYIPKNIESQLLTFDDIVISENEDKLTREKKLSKIMITDIIYNTRINKLSIINSFEFIMLTAYFVGLGIYINKDNREDKYIEIINYISDLEDETKSEEIINKFERYLSLIDKLDTFGAYLDAINKANEEIDNCESLEEVKELVNNFKNEWK